MERDFAGMGGGPLNFLTGGAMGRDMAERMGGEPFNFSSGGAMGRGMAGRMGGGPFHLGVGMSTRALALTF